MTVYALPPEGGRRFGPGIVAKVDHGSSPDFAVFESAIPPRWEGPPLHLHHVHDEAFRVLAGSVEFVLDGTRQLCPAGSFAFVPRGEAHSFGNPSDEPAHILVITSADAILLVEGIYDLLERDEASPAAMAELYRRHRGEVLPPTRTAGSAGDHAAPR